MTDANEPEPNEPELWRDGVSEQAEAELDGLLNAALPFAREMLTQHGAFFPYGATLSLDADLELVAGDPGDEDHPDPALVLDLLYATIRERADGLSASAVLSDVRLAEPPRDAIRVELEHREGIALTVLVDYELLGPDPDAPDGVVLGAVAAVSGEHRTWPST